MPAYSMSVSYISLSWLRSCLDIIDTVSSNYLQQVPVLIPPYASVLVITIETSSYWQRFLIADSYVKH